MLEIARTFQKSLDRLPHDAQAAVKAVAFDFMAEPDRPGFQMHRIDNAREARFWSIRAGRDLRVVVFKDGARTVLCYVDHHDDAYAWAERRRFEVHPVTGSAQIVEIEEVVREEVRTVARHVAAPPLFAHEDEAYLLALGVPPAWLGHVRQVDEDGLTAILDRLPEEAAEALVRLATGERPMPAAAPVPADAFAHPDARRRFWVAADEAALARALEAPWDQWTVFLHPSQRDAVVRDWRGPARVSGGAGTGKTVVALHRAARLAERAGEGRVLLTTFSTTLARHLAQGLDRLMGDRPARARVDVIHLHSLAADLVRRAGGPRFVPVDGDDLDRFIAEAAAEAGVRYPEAAFLRAEWDAVVDYWGLADWPAYRDILRRGRGSPLSRSRRWRVWRVMEGVRRRLDAAGTGTWGDAVDRARAAVEAAVAGGAAPPYAHVVADEAQDFGPRDLGLIRALAPPGPHDLFFAGDVGQRIYRWPFPWREAGVDVRGRGARLTVNYRTTAQIKRFADRLAPARLADVDEAEAVRTAVSLLNGPEPECLGGGGVEAEVTALAAWLAGLLARGLAPHEIGVFARTARLLEERAEPACTRAGLAHGRPARGALPEDRAVLATMHAAKGLEFRAVALVGCDADQLPHPRALAAADDADGRRAATERERCLFYVGCTRARDALLITWADAPSPFLAEARPA